MTTYFIAVDNGNRADGYLVANGDSYVARSGGFGRGEIPQGNYKVGGPQRLNPGKKQNRSMARRGDDWRKYRKFAISGVGPTAQGGGIRDPRYPKAPRRCCISAPRVTPRSARPAMCWRLASPSPLACAGPATNAAPIRTCCC